MRRWFVRDAERRRSLADAALLIGWFTLNAALVRFLCCDDRGYSAFWSANAALTACLLMLRPAVAVPTIAVCLSVNVALNLLKPWSLPVNGLYAALNLLQAAIAAFAARRWCGATTDLTRIRRLVTFGVIALGSAVAEVGIGGLTVRCLAGETLSWWDLAQWVCCDALGLLLAMPVTVAMLRPGLRIPSWRRLISQGNLMAVAFGVLTAILATVSFASPRMPLYLFLFPCLSWLATQLGPSLVLMAIFSVSVFASALTVHGIGPVAAMSADGNLPGCSLLQPFLIALLLTVFPANILIAERIRAERRLRLTEARLRHSSTHDPLTLLMNRWLFRRELCGAMQQGRPVALIFLDVDHFKQINDTHGHLVGDRLLQAFAARLLQTASAAGGKAARFGGDEFVLMAQVDTVAICYELCARMLLSLRQPYEMLAGHVVTVSAGAALSGPDCHDGSLLQRADEALYAAKAAGRNTFRVSEPEIDFSTGFSELSSNGPEILPGCGDKQVGVVVAAD